MKNWLIAIVLAFLIGAVSAWYVTNLSWEQRKAEYIAEKYKQLSDLKQKHYIETVRLNDRIREVENEASIELSTVQEKYNRLLKSVNNRSDSICDLNYDRLQHNSARGEDNVSTTANLTKGPKPKGQSGSLRQSCSNYQARELLKVAKDCDNLAIKYNSLLEIYRNYQLINN